MYFEKSASRGQEYPSSQSFAPNSVSGFGASRPTRLPPRGEAGRTNERSTLKRIRYMGGTPAPLSARNGRDARSTWGDGATQAHQTCHSTKRTHFIFAYFSLYHAYFQQLMPFAGAFANGFVLGKRTHLPRKLHRGVSSESA